MSIPDTAADAAAAFANQGSQSTDLTWWDAGDADEIEGHDLVRDEALFSLVGVPFMITRFTFHDGIQRKGQDYRDDFVSVELRIAPASLITARLRAGRLSAESAAKVQPGEMLVVNDGSTGIYRQALQYLAAKQLIILPDGAEAGEKGETIWDLPRSEWVEGAEAGSKGIDVALRCARGLRYSEYSNTFTGDDKARTWYLA
jgi:hypothetical protein